MESVVSEVERWGEWPEPGEGGRGAERWQRVGLCEGRQRMEGEAPC